ncbi:MAG: cell division protein FtsQ/DivIB [Bdellovibrio sp.]
MILPSSLVGIFYYLNQNGSFDIHGIQVILEEVPVGQEAFFQPAVEELKKNLQKYEGLSLWNIELQKFSEEVSESSWIDRLNVKRSWPATLDVYVRPHEVKLLMMSKAGKLVPVIRDGVVLEAIESPRAPDVALLEGEVFAKQAELRKKAVKVIDEIPDEGAFSKKTISEVRYDNKEGFWMTMIKTGIQVKMGEEQIALKAARVSQVVDYLEVHQFDARVIDANLSKKVLVRLRKGP